MGLVDPRPGFLDIISGWTLINLSEKIIEAVRWGAVNGPLLINEEEILELMIRTNTFPKELQVMEGSVVAIYELKIVLYPSPYNLNKTKGGDA